MSQGKFTDFVALATPPLAREFISFGKMGNYRQRLGLVAGGEFETRPPERLPI
jgi:hypothetical protein